MKTEQAKNSLNQLQFVYELANANGPVGLKSLELIGVIEGFTVRLVRHGMKHGTHGCLTNNTGEPMVEFAKDARKGDGGESFIKSYFLCSLLEHEYGVGILLDPMVPTLCISPEGVERVKEKALQMVPMVKNHVGCWRPSFA